VDSTYLLTGLCITYKCFCGMCDNANAATDFDIIK